MLSTVTVGNILQMARDPMIRLVMHSDGLCEDDVVRAFQSALTAQPANNNDAERAAVNDTNGALRRGQLTRRTPPSHPIRQGHIHIIW